LTHFRHRISIKELKESITLTDVSAEGLFRRGKLEFVVFEENHATATISVERPNPNLVYLYKQNGRYSLRIFYYMDNMEHLYLAVGHSLVNIHRDEIQAVRKAFRRFTRTPRPIPTLPPGKPFVEYEAPT
jgi:hypothetical protein